jgi:hypothetical protein
MSAVLSISKRAALHASGEAPEGGEPGFRGACSAPASRAAHASAAAPGKGLPPVRTVDTVKKPRLRSRRRMPLRPFWERGYRSHGYWLGKERIGVVEIAPGKSLELKYRWKAGTSFGQSPTLKDAKRRVEETILMGGRQLPLFEEERGQ